MPVVCLIATPARPTLEPSAVHGLRDAWGGGEVTTRAAGIAAEFPVHRVPAERERIAAEMRARGVDLCVVPDGNRRKKLLIADMDSTMIGQECIDELAEVAGVGDRVREVTARAMNGELGFEGALRERVALLEGLPETTIAEVLAARITDAPGGRALVATMRAHGAGTLLVSGGFTAFSGPVAARLGFEAHQANLLLAEGGRLTGRVAEPILGREAKVAALERETRRRGIAAADVIAVGDGANDLGMLERAGLGVALHAKPAVAAQADVRIDHGDLTALLYLQGYDAADIAG
jgi:phosphoserine phosphatase